ncbi:MAG TPA: PAS domain-containing protein, partial [Candidatus Limnocylindria bacterium]
MPSPDPERDRLRSLLAELPDAIVLADRDDVVRLANPSATQLLAAGELVGHRLVEVVRDHEIDGLTDLVGDLLALTRMEAGDEALDLRDT